jgi:hypothetical protein
VQPEQRDAEMIGKRTLTEAYLRTTYRVLAETGPIDIRIGAVNPALERLLHARGVRTWAFVTASNPRSEPLCDDSNAQRNDAMKQSLREAGWRTVEALGVPDHPDWSAEQSVLIPGIGQQEAVTLGRCWQQNAIVFGRSGEPPELIWID